MAALRLARGGADFPQLLASIPDCPEELFLRGRLADVPAVAIVGSRRPTPYGRRIARRLAAAAARRGLAVVSGLARGIDTEAHEAALEAGGLTWAVLGGGLGRIYPLENRSLADRIEAAGGAVLSEWPADTPSLPDYFPQRNRIISGLAWVTVVVEGEITSGSLITARHALKQGREVGIVPGPVDSPMSVGPLALLKDGATPVGDIDEILALMPPGHRPVKKQGLDETEDSHYKEGQSFGAGLKKVIKESTSDDRQKILKSMGSGEVSFEDLIRATGIDAPATLRILAELEIEGLVDSFPGQHYARR